ncbi:unnamed protein product [Sphagnum jensenii]|uniref:SOSEKI DIX-like domain-containing protein n=1 Tax=Sphagnum jensenii TaxID=128206 RepID=A0ABP1BM16_9BRYO
MSNVLQLADDIPSLTDLHCLCNTGSKNKKQGSTCCCCRSLQSGKMSKQQQMTMKDTGGKAYRKVEVVYHLSQPASSSSLSRLLDHHPHMIQVQFPSDRSGPCLRDVKNRLTSLRGQGMPDAFSWSNKRNYRGTFIWCDLCEDDFILPLRGSGEYILKASELFEGSGSSQDALNSSDVSMAISKSLLLINHDANKLTSGSSCANVNQQAMGYTLSNFETTTPAEVWTLEDSSNLSSSEAFLPHVEATKSNKVPKKMVRAQSTEVSTASDSIAYYPLSSEGNALDPQKVLDVAIQTTGLPPGHPRTRAEINKGTTGGVFLPHTAAMTRDSPLKRRACKKEEAWRSSPVYSGQNPTQSASVSSRNENSGMHVSGLLHGVIPRFGLPEGDYTIGLALKAPASLEGYRARLCRNIDVVESHTQLDSVKKTRSEGKSNSEKQDKETKLISVFLGRHFQTAASSKKMVKESKLDGVGPSGKKSGLYLRLIGDEVFDLGCKKVGVIHQAVSHSKSSKSVGEAATGRLKSVSSSTTHPVSLASVAASSILFNPPEYVMDMSATDNPQRQAQVTPEDIKTAMFSNDSSTPELKKTKAASSASVNPLPPKMHNGSKQGMKSSSTLESQETLSTASGRSITNEMQLWPKDQARPRDFKSMDERPLTPGLTSIDWETMLQAAVSQSQPPPDLVLHECLQCGRTFKLDSLTVHMRGCHAPTKAATKPTVTLLRRVPA